ncbi:37 kDa salivary gland allergen Aed a 2-like isoform X3 [Culex pipiens pallens]|uniref:37 kDa salivary gland allergen Aed a 2-like isoform X3 n=1 Tax=Culex pipiens pallens TaxID=42434 RepID=UPI0019540410|nr:37 kDa salivary gland allergen Aed a 2-like isoform X3 [Culex pipiens pallens]
MHAVLITALLLLLSVDQSLTLSSLAFDPEETRFIFTRCIEQYSTSSTEDDSSRLPRIRRWISWSLEAAEDEQTKCFVACLLNKLKLWQPYLGKFRIPDIPVRRQQTMMKCIQQAKGCVQVEGFLHPSLPHAPPAFSQVSLSTILPGRKLQP